jgi:hypothetical protein
MGLCDDCIDAGYEDLLRRMGRQWGITIRRQSTRNRVDDMVSVCVGIRATHYFINGEQPFVAPDEEYVEASGEVAQAEDDPPSVYVDLDALAEEQADAGDEAGADAAPQSAGGASVPPARTSSEIFHTETWHAKESYQVYRWQTRDESAGGLALEREGEFEIRLRVGDLLAVRQDTGSNWRVAVVRWLKSATTDYVEIGVQLLAPEVRPAAIRQEFGKVTSHRFTPALLLPANEHLRLPDTLIVPRGTYQEGGTLTLMNGHSAPSVITPLELLDRTGGFEHISYAPVNVQA